MKQLAVACAVLAAVLLFWLLLPRDDAAPTTIDGVEGARTGQGGEADSLAGDGGQGGRVAASESPDGEVGLPARGGEKEPLSGPWDFERPSPTGAFLAIPPVGEYPLELFRPIADERIQQLGGEPEDLEDLHAMLLEILRSPSEVSSYYVISMLSPSAVTHRLRREDDPEDERLKAAETIEAAFADQAREHVPALVALVESDYYAFVGGREYIVFEEFGAVPDAPRRGPNSLGQFISIGRWYVDATYDPLGHAAIESALQGIRDAREARNEAIRGLGG